MQEDINCINLKCQYYSKWIAISCLAGLLLSFYALYVEIRFENQSNYKAMCDISEKVSCTKVVASQYGRGFGILEHIFGKDSILNQRNPIMGIFAYTLIAFLGYTNNILVAKIQVIIGVTSIVLSMYLAYLLYVLNSLCLICVSTYFVNYTTFMLSWKRYELLKQKLKTFKEIKSN